MTLPPFEFEGGEWADWSVEGAQFRCFRIGAGPPLILIHGLSASAKWWERNLLTLSTRYEVFAVDLIASDESTGGRVFTLRDASHRLATWMTKMHFPAANLLGHSMGGAIAAEVAADYPALVRRLVLVDAAALFPKHGLPLSPPDILRNAVDFPPDLVPVLLTDMIRTGPKILLKATWDVLRTDLRAKLVQISCPTLVLWGARDGLVPLDLGREIASLLRNAKLEILPFAGHNPMWESSYEFNQRVMEFLADS